MSLSQTQPNVSNQISRARTKAALAKQRLAQNERIKSEPHSSYIDHKAAELTAAKQLLITMSAGQQLFAAQENVVKLIRENQKAQVKLLKKLEEETSQASESSDTKCGTLTVLINGVPTTVRASTQPKSEKLVNGAGLSTVHELMVAITTSQHLFDNNANIVKMIRENQATQTKLATQIQDDDEKRVVWHKEVAEKNKRITELERENKFLHEMWKKAQKVEKQQSVEESKAKAVVAVANKPIQSESSKSSQSLQSSLPPGIAVQLSTRSSSLSSLSSSAESAESPESPNDSKLSQAVRDVNEPSSDTKMETESKEFKQATDLGEDPQLPTNLILQFQSLVSKFSGDDFGQLIDVLSGLRNFVSRNKDEIQPCFDSAVGPVGSRVDFEQSEESKARYDEVLSGPVDIEAYQRLREERAKKGNYRGANLDELEERDDPEKTKWAFSADFWKYGSKIARERAEAAEALQAAAKAAKSEKADQVVVKSAK